MHVTHPKRLILVAVAFAAFLGVGTYIGFEESTYSKLYKANPSDFAHNRALSTSTGGAAGVTVITGADSSTRFNNGQMVIAFVFFGLLVGMLIQELKKKFHFPYAPVLMIVGAVTSVVYQSTSWVGETQDYVVGTDPHLILILFMTPIVFEAAWGTNAWVMKRNAWPIFVVAGPAAILTAFLLSLVFRFAFYYKEELGWDACFILGCIFAMTDPVSIGDLVKRLPNAREGWKILLEAESHFTDGSVFLLFTLVLHGMMHNDQTTGQAAVGLIQGALGGPAMGIAFAIPAIYWLKKVRFDLTLGVTITIFFAYITFFVSEFVLHVSGVLAVEFFGQFLGMVVKPYMGEKLQHAIHTVWSVIVSSIETLLYLIAGFATGIAFSPKKVNVYGDDIWKMFMLWFYIYIIRFLVLTLCWPLINLGKKSSMKFTFDDILGWTWSGFRGVMSILMAMIVVADVRAAEPRYRDVVILFAGIGTLMSMLINYISVYKVLGWLGIDRKTKAQAMVHSQSQIQLQAAVAKHYFHQKKDSNLKYVNWDTVRDNYSSLAELMATGLEQYISLNKKNKDLNHADAHLQRQTGDKKSGYKDELRTAQAARPTDNRKIDRLEKLDLLHEMRERVYSMFLQKANERMEESVCPPDVYRKLAYIISEARYDSHRDIDIMEVVQGFLTSANSYDRLTSWSKTPCIGGLFRYLTYATAAEEYVFMTNLRDIVHAVFEDLDEMIRIGERQGSAHDMFHQALEEVSAELDDDFRDSELAVRVYEDRFPEVVKVSQSKLAAWAILAKKMKHIDVYVARGMLSDREAEAIKTIAGRKIMAIRDEIPKVNLELNMNNIALRFPMLRHMTQDQQNTIRENSKNVETLQAGSFLWEKAVGTFEYCFFVTEGEIDLISDSRLPRKRGPGAILGTTCLGIRQNGTHHNTYKVRTEGQVKGFRVSKQIMLQSMAANSKFSEDVWTNAFPSLVHSIDALTDFNPMVDATDSNLRKVGKHSTFAYVPQGESIQLKHGGLLVEGLLKRGFAVGGKKTETFYDGLTFILPSLNNLLAEQNCEVIIFDEPIFRVNHNDYRGTYVELDLINLGKSTAAKHKWNGKTVFGNMQNSMVRGTNDQQWRVAAKDALLSERENKTAVSKLLDTKIHEQGKEEDHHDQARQMDQLMSNIQNEGLLGQTQGGNGDRASLTNYQNLRRQHTNKGMQTQHKGSGVLGTASSPVKTR